MSSKSDKRSPREVILARRALYLSTALATVACGNNSQSPRPPSQDKSTPKARASATSTAVTTAAKAPFEEVLAKRPPVQLPTGLSASEQRHLSLLNTRLEQQYAAVGAVWKKVPGCDPSADQCTPEWQKVSENFRAMHLMMDRQGFAPCAGAAGFTGSYVQRRRAHVLYLRSLTQRIEAHLSEVAKGYSYASEGRWQRMLADAKRKPPMPCLSPCRMPELSDITSQVMFLDGSAQLRLKDPTTLQILNSVAATQRGHGARASLEIRGHADSRESEPDKLAMARAKAVQAWLAAAGIATTQLRHISLSRDLPIEGSDKPEANRRVDFRVVVAPKAGAKKTR